MTAADEPVQTIVAETARGSKVRWMVAITLTLLGLIGFLNSNFYLISKNWYLQYAQMAAFKYSTLLIASCGAALFLTPVICGMSTPSLTAGRRYAGLLIVSLAMVAFILTVGNWQYGAADCSAMIDIAWRMLHGQRLYADFIGPFPPAFALGAKMAFQLFGVHWDAFVYLAAIFAVVTFLWTYALLRVLEIPYFAAVLLAISVQASTQLMIGYWWYNTTTSTMSVVFLLSALAFWRAPGNRGIQLSLALVTTLLFLMKPNAWPMLLGTILILSTSKRLLRPLATLLVVAILLSLAIGLLANFSYVDMWNAYRTVAASRGNPFTNKAWGDLGLAEQVPSYAFAVFMLIPVFVMLGRVLVDPNPSRYRAAVRPMLICLCAIANGLLLMQTNMEFMCSNLIVALPGVYLLVFRYAAPDNALVTSSSPRFMNLPHYLVIVAVSVMTIGPIVIGYYRVRVYTIGPLMFFETPARPRMDVPPLFAGMTLGNRLPIVLGQCAGVVERYHGKKFLFGPRMQMGYAAFNLPSPRNQPIAYDAGTMYAKDFEPELVRRFADDHFDVVILLVGDFTYMPDELISYLQKNYIWEVGPTENTITVLVRKDIVRRSPFQDAHGKT